MSHPRSDLILRAAQRSVSLWPLSAQGELALGGRSTNEPTLLSQGAQSTCSFKKMEIHVLPRYLIISLMVINKYCVSTGHVYLCIVKVISSKLSFEVLTHRRCRFYGSSYVVSKKQCTVIRKVCLKR